MQWTKKDKLFWNTDTIFIKREREKMKNKVLIIASCCVCMFVVALVTTILVLASGNHDVSSNLSVIYVASEIGGSVSATYKVGDNETKNMTNGSGETVINFGSDKPQTLSLLSPNEAINLLYGEDVVLTYTFTNAGEEYYANMAYSDTDTPYTNLIFRYKSGDETEYSTTGSTYVVVPRLGTATFSVKISIDKAYLNADLKGTIDWALVKEKTQVLDKKVSLCFSNNAGSIVNQDLFTYETREKDGVTQFKIIGATPIIENATTSDFVNGNFDNRATIASTGKITNVSDITNSSGAEFYYFCTNPAVVSSTGYNDPKNIYYTSTQDNTLESWYDMPTQDLTIYSCFMTPNYTTETVYSGSASQVIISNKVKTLVEGAFYRSTMTDVVIPQSVVTMEDGNVVSNSFSGVFASCKNLGEVVIPNSIVEIPVFCFAQCSQMANITIGHGVKRIKYDAFIYTPNVAELIIPEGVEILETQALYGMSGIKKLSLPFTLMYVGDSVLRDCLSLTEITISPNCEYVEVKNNCIIRKTDKALVGACKNSVFPNDGSIERIESFIFGQTKVTDIYIPASVNYINGQAFAGMTRDFTVDSNNETFFVSGNCIINKKTKELTCGTTNSIIPTDGSVTSIGDSAFFYSYFEEISIPNSVTNIGHLAFGWCVVLKTITLPNNLNNIGANAFRNCSELTSVTFADTSKTWTANSQTISVTDPAQNATYFKLTYRAYAWTKNV